MPNSCSATQSQVMRPSIEGFLLLLIIFVTVVMSRLNMHDFCNACKLSKAKMGNSGPPVWECIRWPSPNSLFWTILCFKLPFLLGSCFLC